METLSSRQEKEMLDDELERCQVERKELHATLEQWRQLLKECTVDASICMDNGTPEIARHRREEQCRRIIADTEKLISAIDLDVRLLTVGIQAALLNIPHE